MKNIIRNPLKSWQNLLKNYNNKIILSEEVIEETCQCVAQSGQSSRFGSEMSKVQILPH